MLYTIVEYRDVSIAVTARFHVPRQRVMVPYPPEVIAAVDKIVSHGERTAFLVDLAKREILLRRQREALRAAAGEWRPEDHPELTDRAEAWVREIRRQSVKGRIEKIEREAAE